jgi:hypothetical protein
VKLLLEENLSPQHAIVLREQGYDAIAVIEAGLKGQPDEMAAEFALREMPTLPILFDFHRQVHPG